MGRFEWGYLLPVRLPVICRASVAAVIPEGRKERHCLIAMKTVEHNRANAVSYSIGRRIDGRCRLPVEFPCAIPATSLER